MSDSQYNSMIRPLLEALEWRGTERQIHDSLPVDGQFLDLQSFRDAMAHLGYTSVVRRADFKHLNANIFPVIYLDEQQQATLLKSAADAAAIPSPHGTFLVFRMVHNAYDDGTTSLRYELRRFHPLLRQILLLSLIISGVALAPILFNRVVYDHIIAAGSTKGMTMMVVGVLLAMAAEMILRQVRNRWLGFFGGRVDHFVSCSVFERLMYLPPLYTERASVSAQLARLRDFENVREFFTGPLATLFFEMPLVVIYLLVMAVMAQWLALVPVVLVLCYVVLILLVNRKLKEYGQAAATAATQRQEFLLETVSKLRALRLAGMEKAWLDRYHILSGQASLAAFRSGFAAQALETASYILMTIGGIATLGFGVLAVIGNHLSVGALVASMMLIWRIIAPMQICCASITRIQQLASSTKQVQRLLGVAPERDPYAPPSMRPNITGRISFHRVSLRYSAETEPAILGVSFDAKPGQIIAIKGGNGSGKSTLLKLVLGLYQPQGGSVRIDGVDIRQFDPIALRQAIAYIPQSVDLFPGTIRDNLMYADPVIDEKLWDAALTDACAAEELAQLPHGIDTTIEGENATTVPFMLRHRLNLARAYIKPAPIMLFDEASYSLGKDNDEAFVRKINSLRGKSTVLLVTHREDHMQMADILLVMDKGELTHAGPPDQVLTVLRGKRA